MFSGIIDAVGEVRTCEPTPAGRRLSVHAPGYWTNSVPGASAAVDGVCLTVVAHDGSTAEFDVVAETLRRTTLGTLRTGDRVNLQKSLRSGDPIDGHFVQGHVDATAVIDRIDRAGGESMWWFRMDAEPMAYIVPKGSVAIDGISLTIASAEDGRFAVALIPTTLERTTLGQKKIGQRVNVESDILVRTVVHCLRSFGGQGKKPLTAETLSRLGIS